MPRILVFMSDNRTLAPTLPKAGYNSLVAAINSEYCKRHGYDFVYYRPYYAQKEEVKLLNCVNPVTQAMRHASWSKLLSTSLALQLNYDYICYVDSDCIFKDFHMTIEEFLQPYSDKDILFLNDKPWSDTMPCAGFYICKVNERTKQFVHDWYAVNLPDKDTKHSWEQSALRTIYQNYNIGIVDSWMFREKEGQFLRHIGTDDGANRVPYFTSFLHTHNIDYAKTIQAIPVREFDTNPHKNSFDVPWLFLGLVVCLCLLRICLYAGTWNLFGIVRACRKQLGFGKRGIL
jgi:hypothetical protein